jgi:type IX secretion system PorP/SprF family membrane protein
MKGWLLPILLLFGLSEVNGQQSPVTTQYMFNNLLINPAYAGSKPFTSAALMVRKQWAGFKGSPTTETASIHGALEDKNVGLGLYVSNDHAGITNRTELFGSYSYTLSFGEAKLAFGLQAGFSYLKSTLSDLIYNDNNDPVYQNNTINNVLPNFGAGVYFHTDLFYAGISAPLLLSYDPLKTFSFEIDDAHRIRRHYFATSGYVFSLSEQVKLKPSFLIKYVSGAPVQFDINANLLLNNIIWTGVSYRSNDAIALIGEYQLTKKLRIGYSFDYTLSVLRNYSAGSHEFMLGYDFGYKVPKVKTPRYF